MKKRIVFLVLLALCVLLSGCADKETREEEKLIKQYVDMDVYESGNGPKLNYVVDEVQVYGKTLRIGMPYDDVILQGFQPVDTEFKNTVTSALAYTAEFVTVEGNAVKLGFIGEEGLTVAEGVRYSITLNGTFECSIGELKIPNKLDDILSVLGTPYSVSAGAYSEALDVRMEYRCEERDLYLNIYADLETANVYCVSIEGYAR